MPSPNRFDVLWSPQTRAPVWLEMKWRIYCAFKNRMEIHFSIASCCKFIYCASNKRICSSIFCVGDTKNSLDSRQSDQIILIYLLILILLPKNKDCVETRECYFSPSFGLAPRYQLFYIFLSIVYKTFGWYIYIHIYIINDCNFLSKLWCID